MFGTNGGGFFNGNSAHPFENPTALTNLVQMVSIFAIGAALTNVFGRMVGKEKQGWALVRRDGPAVPGRYLCRLSDRGRRQPGHRGAGRRPVRRSDLQPGGNMEGKGGALRHRQLLALHGRHHRCTSCGAVNTMHDSLMPLAGLIPMLNIQLGEIIFGGVGSGLYGMLLFAIIAVFVAGLMVGRTPEYIGKKLEAREVKMSIIAILILPLSILGFTAIATVVPQGIATLEQ